MVRISNEDRTSIYFKRFGPLLILLLLLLIPVGLSNHPLLMFLSGLVLVAVFSSGYLICAILAGISDRHCLLLSPVFGILCLTTLYDAFARLSLTIYFFYLVAALSASGVVVIALRGFRDWASRDSADLRTVLAGGSVVLLVCPLFWRSGRFSGTSFVFRGPAGQDHLFHVTLLQRLLQHVPPDNFMFAGLKPTIYHYFGDQAIAMILRAQQLLCPGTQDLFDVYYRCYPTLIYFLLGALAYFVGRQILGTAKGGLLSIFLVLLGAGGLGWAVGILQTAHAKGLHAIEARLFSSWTAWDGVDAVLPLVHRPAHYNSLLICLAAISILLRPQRTRRCWMLSGLLLGLMAGFNFTLAATFGAAAVLGAILSLVGRNKNGTNDLAWLAVFIIIGSLPVNTEMLVSGFHNMAPGFPFRGPNLEFTTSAWGPLVSRVLPAHLVPIACLIVFPIFAYGLKLFGLPSLWRLDLGEEHHRPVAILLAVTFFISLLIGTFFPYQGLEVSIIFLQPTIWILGLFALRPMGMWLQRNATNWRAVMVWTVIAGTCGQSLLAFNFSHECRFARDTIAALQDIRMASTPQDVVAYIPSYITHRAVLGDEYRSTNFAIMAMTGLDGYFSSQVYSKFNAVPGLAGKAAEEILEKAELLYEQRLADVESFTKGDITAESSARLMNDRVRWIVVAEDEIPHIRSSVKPWRRTHEIVIYKLSR